MSSVDHSNDWLTHQWIVAGMVSASARFIPIPFLDDIVRNQCRRFVVSRTVDASERQSALSDLKPYYSSDGGCIAGCFAAMGTLPFKLLLFPVRKIFAIVTAVHGVPMEIIRTVLLGRTLQRQLDLGEISAEDAARMKVAFNEAFSRMDLRTVRATVEDAVRSVHGWKSAAMKSARKVASDQAESNIPSSGPVDLGADKVQAVLQRPETARLFAEFDTRFDEAYLRTNRT